MSITFAVDLSSNSYTFQVEYIIGISWILFEDRKFNLNYCMKVGGWTSAKIFHVT